MPFPISDFVNSVGAGLSEAADNPEAAQRFRAKDNRRKALSDLELQAQTQQILGDVSALQQRRMRLDPKSPTYQQDLNTIDQSLHDARAVFTDLYHPQNNPGALDKLGGYIKSHLGGQKQNPGALTPAQIKGNLDQRIAAVDSAAYAPGSVPEYLTPDEKRHAARIGAGIDPRATDKTEAENWQTHDIKLADGSTISAQYNTKSGTWRDLGGTDIPKEKLVGAMVQPKATPTQSKPVRAWKKDSKGKVYSVLVDPKSNQLIPGSENYDILPPSSMGGRISTHFFHFVDDKGDIHQLQETTTTTPQGGGASPDKPAPAPAPVKTPGEGKTKAAALAPNAGAPKGVPGDKVVGRKDTPVQSAARKKWTEAISLDTVAIEVAKHPHDAVNQKRLAVQLERESAKRFTTQALDYIIKAGWGNTIEQWANNPTTGELPEDIMRQLIDGAHENLTGAKAALDASLGVDPDVEDILKALKPPPAPPK